MIAFGSAILDPAAYIRYARPGILAAAEPGATVLAFEAVGSVCRSNNLLLDAAAARDDLEALILVEEHVEIEDLSLCAKVREALSDPDVAVVGWMGAGGVRSIAWWEDRVSCGPVRVQYDQYGGGVLPAFAWREVEPPPATVDMVDGSLMALAPWAVRELRFDETLHLGAGYDIDYCARVRAAGRKVVTAPIAATHHRRLDLVRDRDLWVEAHIDMAERWNAASDERDWRARARRAEAERDAARTASYSMSTQVDAVVAPLERELAAMTSSPAWRLTAPLRALNRVRKRR